MDGMINAFFLDTYAIFEINNGNQKYERFKGAKTATTIFNIAELNYGLKKEKSIDYSDEITKEYESIVVSVTGDDVRKAMTFRLKHKDMSIPDAIGYTVAQRLGVLFLTGDDDLKELPHVEFVKK